MGDGLVEKTGAVLQAGAVGAWCSFFGCDFRGCHALHLEGYTPARGRHATTLSWRSVPSPLRTRHATFECRVTDAVCRHCSRVGFEVSNPVQESERAGSRPQLPAGSRNPLPKVELWQGGVRLSSVVARWAEVVACGQACTCVHCGREKRGAVFVTAKTRLEKGPSLGAWSGVEPERVRSVASGRREGWGGGTLSETTRHEDDTRRCAPRSPDDPRGNRRRR